MDQIPELDSPFDQNAWRQPSRESILIDATHACMTQDTFAQLAEYSTTMPTGVYPGKMWRRHDGIYDKKCPVESRRWLLCWYGLADNSMCPIEFREVLII